MGVYATMFTMCMCNARDRNLINKFMDVASYVPTHPGNNGLVSVFKIPGNLVKLQTLVYNVCKPPCTSSELETTYVKYCRLTQMIFGCVEFCKLSFSDWEQFEASKWMICNLEAMTTMRDDSYMTHRVQAAICTHMNLNTIGKLFQEVYIQRLADTVFEDENIFHALTIRWNEMPNNLHPWTLDTSEWPYSFSGLSP